MRNGESNGVVVMEECNFIPRDEVLQAVYVDFLGYERQPRQYPKCYLYNTVVRQYVKIQYHSLIHYLSHAPDDCIFSIRVERSIYNNNPQVIYVR